MLSPVASTVAIMLTSFTVPAKPAISTKSPTLNGSLMAIIMPEARLPSDSWNAKPRMKPVTPSPAISGATLTPSRPRTIIVSTAQHALTVTDETKSVKSVFFLPLRVRALRTSFSMRRMARAPRSSVARAMTALKRKSTPLSESHASDWSIVSRPSATWPCQPVASLSVNAWAVSTVFVFIEMS